MYPKPCPAQKSGRTTLTNDDPSAHSPRFADHAPNITDKPHALNGFRMALLTLSDAIYTANNTGRITFANAACETLTGYSVEELIGRLSLDLYPPEAADIFVARRAKAYQGHQLPPLVSELIHKTGRRIPVELSVTSIMSGSQVSGRVTVLRDISERREAERTRSLLAAIVNSTDDAIIGKTLHGTITSWNVGAERLYGYTADEVIGRSIALLVPPDRLDELSAIYLKLRRGEHIKHFETKRLTKDGRLLDIGLTISPIKGTHGAIIGASAIARDITVRKRSETRFRLAIEASPSAMVMVNPEGQIVLVNAQTERIFGYTRDELLGLPVEHLIPERFRAQHIRERGRFLDAPTAREMGVGRDLFGRCKDGTEVPVEIGLCPLEMDDGMFILSAIVDISAHKQAEEELRRQREWFEVTLSSIGDAVMTTDTKGVITFMNAVAEEITGWPTQKALGQPIERVFQILHESTRRPMPSPIGRVLQEERVVYLESHAVLCARDGREVAIADSGAPIHSAEGELVGVVLVFRDVSVQQRMEAELLRVRKIESVGVLAGGIAHDFNNLLTGILGNISLAKRLTGKPEAIMRRLEEAEKACERATALTHQLLTFSKGGAPVRETASIEELLYESVAFALRGASVAANFYVGNNLWPVDIDEGQMNQVFHNVVINAVHAMPEGGTITVRADNIVLGGGEGLPLPAGRYVAMAVEDTGIGIPHDLLQDIFDPYITTKEDGHGLGLATAYVIVRKHEGTMTVESQEEVGTSVRIYLPASSSTLVPASTPVAITSVGGGRILVMDDEEMIRDLLQGLLSSLGYDVVCVCEGTEALEAYRQARGAGQPFDAVILDHTIPGGMGGLKTMTRLRELDPQVKALISSGYAEIPVMANWSAYGFRGAIPKPYAVEQLQETLGRVLQEAR
jgi:PAS domain S-box-containing protein